MKRTWMLIAIAFAVVVVGVNIALSVLNRSGGVVTGPDGSAAVTTEGGYAGFRSLLDESGHETRLLGEGLAGIENMSTVVVVSTSPNTLTNPDDLDRLGQFVDDGGTMVWIGPLETGEAMDWTGWGDFTDRELTADIVIDESSPFSGEGTIRHLASIEPFMNMNLARGDHALAALRIVDAGDVGFVETQFGLTKSEATGFDALPKGWIAAFLGLLGATLIGISASGRSLGEPDADDAPRPPSRAVHVDALAAQIRPIMRRERIPIAPPAPAPSASPASNDLSAFSTKETQ